MTILLSSKSGPDSKLHLEIPVSEPNAEFFVEVVVRPKAEAQFPPDYFKLLGSIDDDTLMVHPQPALPPPAVELE